MKRILKVIFLEILFGIVPIIVGIYWSKWEQRNKKAKDCVVDV